MFRQRGERFKPSTRSMGTRNNIAVAVCCYGLSRREHLLERIEHGRGRLAVDPPQFLDQP